MEKPERPKFTLIKWSSESVRELDPARLEDIQAKVEVGVYLSFDVADAVAREIMERGDL